MRNKTIDLIMLSKFGKNDGGRETWAYNFLPILVEHVSKINVFAYRELRDEDNSSLLLKIDTKDKQRVNPLILVGKKNRFPKFFSMFFHLKLFLRKFNKPSPDYVIAMGIFELILMLTNKRFKNSFKIVWLRGIFLNEKSSKIPTFLVYFAEKFEKYLLKKADLLLANGDDIKSYYDKYNLDITVIKNGVDITKWEIPSFTQSNIMKIAYIGRLSKVKGIESFLELVEKIKTSSNSNNFEFHIAGDANEYISNVTKFTNNNWITYHGNIENDKLPIFLKDIHICVALTFSSLFNGSTGDNKVLGGGGTSNALLEQMAASKIILAWDNAHFRQILDDDSAYLVEQYAVSDLYQALLEIYSNQDEAIKRGINANKIIQPYTIEAQVEKFKKVIAL